MATVLGHSETTVLHVKADTLAIMEHFDHHHVRHTKLQNNRNNYSNRYIIHSPTAVGFTEVYLVFFLLFFVVFFFGGMAY